LYNISGRITSVLWEKDRERFLLLSLQIRFSCRYPKSVPCAELSPQATEERSLIHQEKDFTKNPTTSFADPPPLKGRLNKKAENVPKNVLRFSFLFA